MINFLKTFLVMNLFHISLSAHCQIPCGIYSDVMQVIQIKEDLRTIEKSTTMIKKLSGKADPKSLNQISRWISSKDEHAQNIQNIISQYFLTQRIKQSSKNYENELITLHQLLISVMKCKQNVNEENIKRSNELLDNFSEFYFDDHDLEHIKDFEKIN
tara:strand:+ start:464 stop:937 length:474 start_codon:yes stop_codon:yes gene_type:complete